MKRILFLIILTLFAATIYSQSSEFYDAVGDHYRVLSEVSTEHAQNTVNKLEALLELYNSYFHFKIDALETKLKVRIFAGKSGYDNYLTRIISETREDFVYLHYSDMKKSELVGYYKEEKDFDLSLTHQNFIQYLRAFVPNPPLWLREGFAVYFEQTRYDSDFDAVVYKENLSWLETIKAIIAGEYDAEPITFEELITVDVSQAKEKIEVFYPQAWAAVSFLLNSWNKDYNRIIWDSISALQKDASLEENASNVKKEAFAWVNEETLIQDFIDYIDSKKSFKGYVENGIELYSQSKLVEAEEAFIKALNLEKENYIPYYYLGLINYDRGNYSLADYYYKTALDKGSVESLTYYALGVNAYADNRYEDAKGYLQKTKEADPAKYSNKVETLLNRIEVEQI